MKGSGKAKLVGDVKGKFDAGICWEETRLYTRSGNIVMNAGISSSPILISHSTMEMIQALARAGTR